MSNVLSKDKAVAVIERILFSWIKRLTPPECQARLPPVGQARTGCDGVRNTLEGLSLGDTLAFPSGSLQGSS